MKKTPLNPQHTALVTGASSGLGLAFCHALAQKGMSLILVARRADKLEGIAAQLTQQYGIACTAMPMDLTQPNAALMLRDLIAAAGLRVDVLVNNAGFSTYGAFGDTPLHQEQQLLRLNIMALTDLCHAFMPLMAQRGFGVVFNLCSTTSFFPLPSQATYAASKAYVLSLSEALWYEFRSKGVRVVGVCPGATDTEFFDILGQDYKGAKAAPSDVVRTALNALDSDQCSVVHGFGNALQAKLLPRMLTRRGLVRFVGKVSQNVFR